MHRKEFITKTYNFIRRIPVLGKFIRKMYKMMRNLRLKIKLLTSGYDIPHPDKIYWISPEEILYHTNYGSDDKIRNNVFDMRKDRGAVYDGDWDKTNFRFVDLMIYKAFEKHIQKNTPWNETEFYKDLLSGIDSGEIRWGCKNKADVDRRFEYFDELIKSIREKGYISNKDLSEKDSHVRETEITVNIGRNGEFLFQNGRHRLSIAKILGMKSIPIQILVRHKEWQVFKEKIKSRTKSTKIPGCLYQPLLHPDLQDIPSFHTCEDRFTAIKNDLTLHRGTLLDLGANLGYFSFKFENMGFQCVAVESDEKDVEVIDKLAKQKNIELVQCDMLDERIMDKLNHYHFDIVLALNIFHHFIKTKDKHEALKKLLEKLNIGIMYFEPHSKGENQMKNSYLDYSEEEFIQFIFSHTKLKSSEKIYQANDGRNIYRLSS